MSAPTSSDTDQEQGLKEMLLTFTLLTFVEAEEKGQAPNRRQFLADHPEFAAELAQFFADRDRLECLAAPWREARRAGRIPASLSGALTPGPGDPPTPVPAPRPAPGASGLVDRAAALDQLGDFRLVKQIGQGGMGTVYEAYQVSLRRRVALKVLPQAAALDPKQLQRFQNEAQAAAYLHHPNIVPVYAVGSDRDVHFYAMQFIEGQSLAALINDLRQPALAMGPGRSLETSLTSAGTGKISATNGTHVLPDLAENERTEGGSPAPGQPVAAASPPVPSPASTISTERTTNRSHFFRRIARLALTAAEALEHAHQMGVVHRDIKPANLLLDGQNNLWITDFGLALLHNNAGLTTTGELLGTLRYMSPEQAGAKRGLVDHRTDIYSLGVTLYELLTLEPLFPTNDGTQLLHQIAFEEPCPPRALDRTIPFELETIVLKALAKAPAERYATAQELADDLKRFLEDEPVMARRPSLVDRARKWSRRHKPVVVCGMVLLLVFLVGLPVTTIMIASAHSETKEAYQREIRKAEEAEKQRARAEANFVQARRAIEFLTQLGVKELVDEPDVLEVRRKLLEGALHYYQEFIDQQPDDASIHKELTLSRARVAELLGDLSSQQDYLQFTFLLNLLAEKGVQEDLHISTAQREKIANLSGLLAGQRREAFLLLRRSTDQERVQKFKEMAAANKSTIAEILTAGQISRLKQIAFQQMGPMAFSETEVVKALALDKDQKARIRTIHDRARHALSTAANPIVTVLRQTKLGKGYRTVPQIWKQTELEIVALLRPEQKASWTAITGEPFRGRIHPALPTTFVRAGTAAKKEEGKGWDHKFFGGELVVRNIGGSNHGHQHHQDRAGKKNGQKSPSGNAGKKQEEHRDKAGKKKKKKWFGDLFKRRHH